MPAVWELVVGHILLVGGCFIFARGLLLALGSPATPREIFVTKPFFWGLFTLLGGFCSIFAGHLTA